MLELLSFSKIDFKIIKKRRLSANFLFILLLFYILCTITHYALQAESHETYINFSITPIIKYSFYQSSMAFVAFVMSFVFTIIYGYFIYKNKNLFEVA